MTERVAGPDRFEAARSVADAVLYEGYVLYPYRASSRKNQIRWQFGVLMPRSFCETEGSERWWMRTECLATADDRGELAVRVRFLHLQRRSIEAVAADSAVTGGGASFVATESLDVDGVTHVSWDEAVDRTVDLPLTRLFPTGTVVPSEHVHSFRIAAGSDQELLYRADGTLAGRVTRIRDELEARATVQVEPLEGGFHKITVRVENASAWSSPEAKRDDAVTRSLIAVHIMMALDGGRFVSLLDPPAQAADAAAACRSDGAYPVLIGSGAGGSSNSGSGSGGSGRDDVILASPIILYDHPEVAPESPGDLYDSTEIDEILALRVLTLTDAEKAEARGTDARAAAIIDRCDNMPPEMWDRLHGAVRSISPATPEPASGPDDESWYDRSWSDEAIPTFTTPASPTDAPEKLDASKKPDASEKADDEPKPWWDPGVDASADPATDTVWIAGVEVGRGSPVRLRPSHRADAHDLFLAGLSAKVAGVFRDVDGGDHIAVTLDDDPASPELVWQGRYLYFHADEIEPIRTGAVKS